MTWIDDELALRVNVSTSGDFVKLGTTTTYPFTAGGSGMPAGWSQYLSGGGVATDVSWDTSYGRFSIGNIGTDIHGSKRYGIYRDFNIVSGKRYLIQVQCRTTANRTTSIRYVEWAAPASDTRNYSSQVWSYDDWEQVSLYTAKRNDTTLRVWLFAAPYTLSTIHAPSDANWGIQFQNFAIVQQDEFPPTPVWHNVVCDVRSLVIHYGRDRFLNRFDVASATIEVVNNEGTFNYASATDWGLRPGRFISITGDYNFAHYDLYFGIIDRISNGFTIDGKAFATLECVDVSSLLSNYTVPSYSDQGETMLAGYRFRNLLYSVGWHPSYMAWAPQGWNQQAILANGRNVRDELGLISDSEGGAFYTTRDGRVYYYDRSFQTNFTEVRADITATPYRDYAPKVDDIPNESGTPIIEAHAIQTEWSRDRVVNQVTLANQNGTAIVTQDYASQTKYGPRTYQRLDFLNDNAHPEYLDQRTQDIMSGYTDAVLRVNTVEFRPRAADYQRVMSLWLGQLVRVRYEHPAEHWGFAVVSHIQGFTYAFTPHGWNVQLTIDQPVSFVSYVHSDNGWDDASWDVGLWDESGYEGAYWDSGETWAGATHNDIDAIWEK